MAVREGGRVVYRDRHFHGRRVGMRNRVGRGGERGKDGQESGMDETSLDVSLMQNRRAGGV